MGRQSIDMKPYAKEAARLLGAHIRVARGDLGWTMDELARRIHCSRRTIANIEAGRPEVSIGHVFNAAWATGVLLFGMEPQELARAARSEREKIALMPRHVESRRVVFDEF